MKRIWLILLCLLVIMAAGSFGHWAALLWLPQAVADCHSLYKPYQTPSELRPKPIECRPTPWGTVICEQQ